MLKQIDHVVIVVSELEIAMAGAKTAGFTVSPGGEHDSGDTHNALIAFQDGSYVELLAFINDKSPELHYFSTRHRLGGGLAEFALLSSNLQLDVAAINSRGVDFPAPTDLGRFRPDGVRLRWRMSLPAINHPERGFPFLIEDTTDRSFRVPCDETTTSHANGATGIAGVSVVVSNLDQAAREYRAILDGPEVQSHGFGVAGKGILRIPLIGNSSQWITLIQTFADSLPMAYYKRFGEGPYAVNLRTSEADVQPGEGTLIDPALLGGARFYI